MKNILLTIMFLSSLAVAIDQDKEPGAGRDLSGFSGYGWGTSYNFIEDDMKAEGYKLTTGSSKDLWYEGEIQGERVELVYYFKKQALTSGMWVFSDVDQESFWKVSEFLRETYNAQVSMRVRGEVMFETEMEPPGTDAWIVHTLDLEKDTHVVHYYFRLGEE